VILRSALPLRPMPRASSTLEDGGVDLAWADWTSENWAPSAAKALLSSGYCLVQMPAEICARESLAALSEQQIFFRRSKRELEAAYLGNDSNSKLAWLDWDSQETLEATSAIGSAYGSSFIWEMGNVLASCTLEVLGFKAAADMGPLLLRMPLESTTEKGLLYPGSLDDNDIEEGVVAKHLDFARYRRLCMMYMGAACSDEGSIELTPRWKGSGLKQSTVSLGSNKLFVFRDDLMSHRLQLPNNDVVLQSWLMEEKPEPTLLKVDGSEQAFIEMLGLVGPKAPKGEQTHIMARKIRASGSVHDANEFSALLKLSTDCCIDLCSISRFDMVPYYHEDINQGKSITRHGSLMDDDCVYNFDNAFFKIPEEEVALQHGGTSRMLLESVALLLHEVGLPATGSREDIMTVLSDDHFMSDYWLQAGADQKVTSKIQYLLGLNGPNAVVDTACSSSQVAINMCQTTLRTDGWAENYGSMGRRLKGAVAGGGSLLDDGGGFVGLSQGRMIGETGRSMTFDIGANGYARGESCGVIFLKYGDVDTASTKDRLVCITGSNANQDGRSASLTAPNGPSQAECIRAALRESKQDPAEVVFTELHGTGTALGDPIEVGSMRAVQAKRPSDQPLYHSAGKSLFAHSELNAGTIHVCKMIAQHFQGVITPNQHLRQMNPNAELRACLFPTEMCDVGLNVATSGVSSFGFGGTNCRNQMWSHVQAGGNAVGRQIELQGQYVCWAHAVACPTCGCSMCLWCSQAINSDSALNHRCCSIRESRATYDSCSNCYTGRYDMRYQFQ